uniref:Uncharacterized protein n=1 Tax=Acrobeloides nanus TaxID=290746 RepID=A0A914C383_9BILA
MFIDAYIFISTMIDVIVVLASILDFLILLSVLKSYRNVVIMFLGWMKSFLMRNKNKTASNEQSKKFASTHEQNKRPSMVNNFVNP